MHPHTPGTPTSAGPRPEGALERGRLHGTATLVAMVAKAAVSIPAAELDHYIKAGGTGTGNGADQVKLAMAVKDLALIAGQVTARGRSSTTS